MVYVISFTPGGNELNERLCGMFPDFKGFVWKKEAGIPLKEIVEEAFSNRYGIVFIGAMGIAVRSIAPFIKDKLSDSAVIVADEAGRYVIPVLSGHVGGANALAKEIAASINAISVITTATDVNGLFAVDTFAVKNGLKLKERDIAKEISVALLRNERVCCKCRLKVIGNIPQEIEDAEKGKLGFIVSYIKEDLYDKTLHLVPQNIILGIGCRKNVLMADVEKTVLNALEEEKIDMLAVKKVATIDIKKDEKGLVDFCHKYNIPLEVFSAQQLMTLQGAFSTSAFVLEKTGADNVCERSALCGGGKRLIMKKKAENGVTVAAAIAEGSVNFE